MHLSKTLSLYIGRKYLIWLMITLLSLSAIVFVFDWVELLRRAANKESATFNVVLQMALLKLPNMMEKILPFAVLFGSMAAFHRLTRSQELVIARASGISVWQFTLPAIITTFLLGTFMIMVFNPLASTFFQRFEQMEARYLSGQQSQIAIIEDGVWLRQSVDNKQSVLTAVRLSQSDISLQDVTVFQFINQDSYIGRIDAESAQLYEGYWELKDATATDLQTQSTFYETYQLPTNLTRENILDSFAAPETLSFWQLPGFIDILEKAGFSALKHRLHLHNMYTIPVLLCAMVLIAASFSLQPPRKGQTLTMVVSGIFAGFVLFFVNDLVSALGVSSRIPLVMAAWIPPAIAIMFGIAFLLHMEDG